MSPEGLHECVHALALVHSGPQVLSAGALQQVSQFPVKKSLRKRGPGKTRRIRRKPELCVGQEQDWPQKIGEAGAWRLVRDYRETMEIGGWCLPGSSANCQVYYTDMGCHSLLKREGLG